MDELAHAAAIELAEAAGLELVERPVRFTEPVKLWLGVNAIDIWQDIERDTFHRDKVRRITAAGWPFIVAELDGEIAGYAYVTQFRDRAAYRFTAEDSIYVHCDQMRRGIGKALLERLIERSAAHGFATIVAVIGGAEPASISLHASLGFTEVGRLSRVGVKFGRWLDSVYMQLNLTESTNPSVPVEPE